MILKHIKIQGMHNINKEYDLYPRMFFKGANGSGKSTVLQAIQWALLGYIPGTNKTNSAMFGHCVGPIMSVTLEVDCDGCPVTIYRQLLKAGSTITAKNIVTPECMEDAIKKAVAAVEMPIFNFAEFAGMTANKLKDWFIDYLPKSDCNINWSEFIDSTLRENAIVLSSENKLAVLDVVTSAVSGKSGVDAIRAANVAIKTSISVYNSESKRIASTIQSVVTQDVDDNHLVELRAESMTCRNAIASLTDYYRIKEANAESEDLLLSHYADYSADSYIVDPRYAEVYADYTRLCDELRRLHSERAEYQTLESEQLAARSVLNKIASASGQCPILTDITCNTLIQHKAAVADQLNAVNLEVSRIQNRLDILRRNIIVCENSQRDAERTMEWIKMKYSERDRIRCTIKVLPDISDFGSTNLEYWKDRYAEINKEIGELESNRFAQKLIADKMNVDIILSALKVLDKATGVNGLQSKVESPFIKLVDSMSYNIQDLFGSNTLPTFIVTDKTNSFSFGISRGEDYISYDMLSSGEKAMYCLVLMLSLVRMNECCKLLLIDDMFDHVDDDNLRKIQSLVEKITDVQCIFAGVNPVEGIAIQEVR